MYSNVKDALIFHPSYNQKFSNKILSTMKRYPKIIFANSEKQYKNICEKNKFQNEIYFFEKQYYGNNYCSKFNQQIDNTLPDNIQYIKLGYDFNQTVDNLPINITHLAFDYKFNQRVDNLPFSIKYLIFGYEFNQTVDNIPNSIIYLELSYLFNQKLDDLPIGLEKLIIGKKFSYNINCLPKTLKYLEITSQYYNCDHYNKYELNICALPKSLELIVFNPNNYYDYIKLKIDKQIFNLDNIKYKFGKNKIITY